MGRTVNPLSSTSVVRIHHCPHLNLNESKDLIIESSFTTWCLIIWQSSNHQISKLTSGSSSFGRAVAFQASGGRFEPGLPLIIHCKAVRFCSASRGSSGVEHFLGREGVVSSILTYGSKNFGRWFADFKNVSQNLKTTFKK